MQEHTADNAENEATSPTARWGRLIAPTADLSAQAMSSPITPIVVSAQNASDLIAPAVDESAHAGSRFIVLVAPGSALERSEAGFSPLAHLSRPSRAPQSLELMSEEEFWDYVHERANNISGISPDDKNRSPQYLECKLSCGTFLIPLHALSEVMEAPRHFALLPNIPQWMLGIMVWRGQAIAVLDLNAYLCDAASQIGIDSSPGTMLVANDARHANISVGLFVHLIGMIDNQVYDERFQPTLPIIDMSMLLADVVRQIGIAAHHG